MGSRGKWEGLDCGWWGVRSASLDSAWADALSSRRETRSADDSIFRKARLHILACSNRC
jgi:hypothetical protein